GPNRTERISRKTLETCLKILQNPAIKTVDITGGAPELNPHFRWFVEESRKLEKQVMVRSNLTVIFEPGMEDLPEFYAANKVEVVSSLP
ncbi:radical SAM protein, partial [candidate division KSB1 bacterium]|nr:radical SAM protein [candidate division KSB1 bacterium]